jgi:hypothetical protein
MSQLSDIEIKTNPDLTRLFGLDAEQLDTDVSVAKSE